MNRTHLPADEPTRRRVVAGLAGALLGVRLLPGPAGGTTAARGADAAGSGAPATTAAGGARRSG